MKTVALSARWRSLLRRLAVWRVASSEVGPDQQEEIEEPRRDRAAALHIFADDGLLHVVEGALVWSSESGERKTFHLAELSSLTVHGQAGLTTPALAILARAGVAVGWRDWRGHFVGRLAGADDPSARRAQYLAQADPRRRLELARAFVVGKIAAQADALRRMQAGGTDLAALARSRETARRASDLSALLGAEGAAAALYFAAWRRNAPAVAALGFAGRSRRPATDPVNAALNYAYAMLMSEAVEAAFAAALDPMVGFLHGERAGRPALALDLIEPFRASVAERAVLRLVNLRQFAGGDWTSGEDGVRLGAEMRKAVIAAMERRWRAPADDVGDHRAKLRREAANLARALVSGGEFASLASKPASK